MKKIFTIATLLAVAATLSAQQEGTYNESVVVKGSYRPTIEQAEKINFPAQITDTIGRMEHDFRYSITPMRLRALYEPSRIKAARIVGEPATKLYNNYLRLGVGNYWTPMADLYWSSTRDKKKTYGVRLNHLSSTAATISATPVSRSSANTSSARSCSYPPTSATSTTTTCTTASTTAR